MERFRKYLLLASFIVFSNSCIDNNNEDPAENGVILLNAVLVENRSAEELRTLLELSGYNVPPSVIQYDADVYRVTYRTTFKGQELQASGIVALPDTQNPLSMLSFQHGTIVAHSEAPTESNGEELILYAALASTGFIAVIPDFLGFGSSSEILHPYYVEEYTASAIIDNLKAAKELTENLKLNFNKNLFLAGYSEGGYATMATHKSIEENGLEDFNLVASYPAAGGYDIKDVQERFFSLETYSNPYYIAYVVLAYKNTFDWAQPLTDFFNEPYASMIPDLFNGTKSSSEINASLSDTLSVLINPELLADIDNAEKFQFVVDALESNSLTDWAPVIPMYMYHGDADVTVPYQNSVETYNQLLANGSSSSAVQLITLPGATHSSGIKPYIEDFLPRVLGLSPLNGRLVGVSDQGDNSR